MTKKPPAKPPLTTGQKLGVSIALLLFAAGFGAGGVVGIGGLAEHVHGWYTTRSWQPTMAEVLRANLQTSSGRKSTTYRVAAEYRYDVAGATYTATRVGFGDGTSDNIGHWHEDRYAELDEARRNGRRVLAFYDPRDPAEAVIDREARWGMMLFFLPFAVVFSAVSIGALLAVRGVWRAK